MSCPVHNDEDFAEELMMAQMEEMEGGDRVFRNAVAPFEKAPLP